MIYRLFLSVLLLLVAVNSYSYDQCRPTKEYLKFLNQKIKQGDVLVFHTSKDKNIVRVGNTDTPTIMGYPLFHAENLKKMKRTIDKRSVSLSRKPQDKSPMNISDGNIFTVTSVTIEKTNKYIYEVSSSSGKLYRLSCSKRSRNKDKNSIPCLYAHFQFDKRKTSSHQRFELRDKKRPSKSHKCIRLRQDDREDYMITPVSQ